MGAPSVACASAATEAFLGGADAGVTTRLACLTEFAATEQPRAAAALPLPCSSRAHRIICVDPFSNVESVFPRLTVLAFNKFHDILVEQSSSSSSNETNMKAKSAKQE